MTSLKPKAPASPSPAEGTPLGDSSSMATGTALPAKKSTKIRLQLKNKGSALPSLPRQAPVGDSSSMPRRTLSPAEKFKRRLEFIEGLNLLYAYRSSKTRHRSMAYFERLAAALAGTDQKVSEEPSEKTVLEQHSRVMISESSSSPQAAPVSTFSSAHRENMTTTQASKIAALRLSFAKLTGFSPLMQAASANSFSSFYTKSTITTKPSKIVILKLSPAKLSTFSTSTQAASADPSLKSTSSSSNLASSTSKASPLPIAATSDRIYSSRGRKLRKTYKVEQGDPRNSAAAQNVATQNVTAQSAGQKRKAIVTTTPSKKRVKVTNTDEAQNVGVAAEATSNKDHESANKRVRFTNPNEIQNVGIAADATCNKYHAKTTKPHKSNAARQTRIEIGSRSRAKKALKASREALSRGRLVAREEESETTERGLREKMGKVLKAWEALEKQRDLEAK